MCWRLLWWFACNFQILCKYFCIWFHSIYLNCCFILPFFFSIFPCSLHFIRNAIFIETFAHEKKKYGCNNKHDKWYTQYMRAECIKHTVFMKNSGKKPHNLFLCRFAHSFYLNKKSSLKNDRHFSILLCWTHSFFCIVSSWFRFSIWLQWFFIVVTTVAARLLLLMLMVLFAMKVDILAAKTTKYLSIINECLNSRPRSDQHGDNQQCERCAWSPTGRVQ